MRIEELKKHPYILVSLLAALLAYIVWLFVPKEYTAITKLSDEYKEVDLAVGMTQMSQIRDAMGGMDAGVNDIEVYCQVLKTEGFARTISHKQVPGKGMTYGEYTAPEKGVFDTIEVIQDRINYNVSNENATLIISFTDKEALVASQMLDSVTAQLQQIVTGYRHEMADAALQNAKNTMEAARQKYLEAKAAYSKYTDSHLHTIIQQTRQREISLKRDANSAYEFFKDASVQYTRNMALKQRSYLSFAVIRDNCVPQSVSNYFIGYLLSFVLIALALTHGVKLYQKRKRDHRTGVDWGELFSPWCITILIWSLILGLYYLLDTDLYPITSQFYNCFVIWIPIFLITSFTAYNLLPVSQSPVGGAANQKDSFYFNKSIFTFFFAISLIITPLYLYRILQIVTMFGTEDMMTNIRTLAIYGEGQGFLNYSIVINQSLFVAALWAHPKVPTWQIVLLVIACLMNSLAIMEKGSIFYVFVCVAFVLFEKRVVKLRSILVFGLIMILLLYVFNLARAGEDSDYQEEETLLDFFAMYALSPPVAFCKLLGDVTPQFGTNTFETIYLFLARFGVTDIVVKDKLQEFVWVPISTNVYTIFQPFFIDFGYRGIAFFAGIYGCVMGWLYRLHKNKNSTGSCLYAYAVYVMVLQFYQENVFYSLVFVLQFSFFVFLFTQNKFKFNIIPR